MRSTSRVGFERSPGWRSAAARLLAVAVAVAVAACSEPQPPVSLETYLGSTIAPPRGLDQLRIGMTVDQARAAVPGLGLVADGEALMIESGRPGVELQVKLDRSGTVDGILVTVALPEGSRVHDEDVIAQLTRGWGEPVKSYFSRPVWASIETGWQAHVSFRDSGFWLAFDAYRAVPASVFGSEPRLPGLLAPLTGDMTPEAARATVPELPDVVGMDIGALRIGGDGLRSTIARDGDRFRRIVVYMPSPSRSTVLAAWPGGTEATDEDGLATTMWFDPARRWRITRGPERPLDATLTFEPYRPLAELIGSAPADGIPVVALVSAGQRTLSLPTTEWASAATTVSLISPDPRTVNVQLFYDSPRARDRMLAQLARRWGEPTLDDTASWMLGFVFHAGSPRVAVRDIGTYPRSILELEITLADPATDR